jgi:hypothetical protein
MLSVYIGGNNLVGGLTFFPGRITHAIFFSPCSASQRIDRAKTRLEASAEDSPAKGDSRSIVRRFCLILLM